MTDVAARVPTWVGFCCEEFASGGLIVGEDAVAPYLEATVDGVYAYDFTVPFSTSIAFLGPTVALTVPVDTTDLNTVGLTPVKWTVNKGEATCGVVDWVGTTTVTSHKTGNNQFHVSLVLEGPADVEIWVYLVRDGVTLVAGVPVVMGPTGFGFASFTAVDLCTLPANYTVCGQESSGAGTVNPVAALSYWTTEHMAPPTVSGFVSVFNDAGAFLRQIDYTPVHEWEGTLRASGLTPMQTGDRLMFGVYHTADNQNVFTGTVVTEGGSNFGNAHAEMFWVGPFVDVEVCSTEPDPPST